MPPENPAFALSLIRKYVGVLWLVCGWLFMFDMLRDFQSLFRTDSRGLGPRNLEVDDADKDGFQPLSECPIPPPPPPPPPEDPLVDISEDDLATEPPST